MEPENQVENLVVVADEVTHTPEEQRALEKGWKPKEEWEGPEDEWKPAKVFNEIGELKERLSVTERDLKKSNKITNLMKEHHLNVRKTAYDQAVQDLRAARNEALQAENFAQAEQFRDQLNDIQTRFQESNVLPPAVEAEVRQQVQEPDPEFFAFADRNPWYKPGGRDELSKEADALGAAFKLQNPAAPYKELIANVEKKIRRLYPEKFERPSNPVNEPGSQTGIAPASAVRLSPEQREIAKGFGMTDAEYAKELRSYKGN